MGGHAPTIGTNSRRLVDTSAPFLRHHTAETARPNKLQPRHVPGLSRRDAIMALLGLSLLVASVVYVFIRPPSWMPPWFLQWRGFGGTITPGPGGHRGNGDRTQRENGAVEKRAANGSAENKASETNGVLKSRDTVVVPPPLPRPIIKNPTMEEPEDQTTPKAGATELSQPVPSFALSEPEEPSPAKIPSLSMPPPPPPSFALSEPQEPSPAKSPALSMPPPRAPASSMPPPTSSMRPPPVPGRLPSLQQFPAANSPQRASGPVPNRRPGASSSGLAPPPTHSSAPKKPSRKVLLTPGHSPLDWARVSGPDADLRGLADTSAPYLRVTPTMLRYHTGRKGKDAWMALNGRVYNVTPYADFHPGGVPELMRGAGKDGTRLFGEIHPWVNYETMLSACLVGLLVDEGESEGEMDKMD